MKNSIKVIIIALLITVPALSFAQKAYKFGHLNKQEIILALPEKDSALSKLQKFQKELESGIQTANEEYQAKLQKYLEEKDFEIVSAEFERVPSDSKELSEEQIAHVEKLLEKLEEDEDVTNVFHNMK